MTTAVREAGAAASSSSRERGDSGWLIEPPWAQPRRSRRRRSAYYGVDSVCASSRPQDNAQCRVSDRLPRGMDSEVSEARLVGCRGRPPARPGERRGPRERRRDPGAGDPARPRPPVLFGAARYRSLAGDPMVHGQHGAEPVRGGPTPASRPPPRPPLGAVVLRGAGRPGIGRDDPVHRARRARADEALSDPAPRLSLSALPNARAGGAPAGLGRGAPGVVECGPRTTAPVSGPRGSPALGLRPDQPVDRVAGGGPVVGRGAPQRLRAGARGARCRVAAVLPAAGPAAPMEEEGAG